MESSTNNETDTLSSTDYGSGGRRRIWRDGAALALIVISSLIIWRGALRPGYLLTMYMDNEFLVGPVLHEISTALANGEWPFRMPSLLGGLPLYNAAQFTAAYPLYWLPPDWYGTPLDAARSMHWLVLFHGLIFSANTYVLLRVIGATRLASAACATTVGCGANSLVYASWVNILAPYSWLPLFIAGVIGVIENRRSWLYLASGSVAAIMLALASPAQPVIHALFLACALYATRSFVAITASANRPVMMIATMRLALMASVVFAVCAPVVLPVLTSFDSMLRWIGDYPPIKGHARIPFEAFCFDQMSLTELPGIVVKLPTSLATGSPFIGPVVAALGLISLVTARRSWILFAFTAVAGYSLASSLGSNLGLAHINYHLPLINKIREPSRFLVLFSLSTAVLAALGFDSIRRYMVHPTSFTKWQRLGIASIPMVVSVGCLATVALTADLKHVGSSVIASCCAPCALGFMTLVASKARIGIALPHVTAVCWGLATLTTLAVQSPWMPAPITYSAYLTGEGVELDRAIDRVSDLDPKQEYRLVFEGSINKQYASMLASYRGTRTLSCYFNPIPERLFSEMYHHGPRHDAYLHMLGARYLLCRDCAPDGYAGYRFREQIGPYELHESEHALPYVGLSHRVDGRFNTTEEVVAALSLEDLEEGVLYLPYGADLQLPERLQASSPFRSQITELAKGRSHIAYRVQLESPGVLVINEFFSEDWSARVNGVDCQVLNVNGNQLGVPLESGVHVVECLYRPRSVAHAWIWSALAAFCAGVLGIMSKRLGSNVLNVLMVPRTKHS